MEWQVIKIRKILIYISIFLLITIISIVINIKLKDVVETEKQNIIKLQMDYDKYLEDYMKLNEYVANKDLYISEFNKINSILSSENILINHQ